MFRRSHLSLFFLVVVALPSVYGFLLVDDTSWALDLKERASLSQSGWLADWQYRKPHTMTGSTGAGTDYQIRIVVHYSAGADSGADVHCDSQCQPDYDDIRFTSDDGITPLAYWRENYTASSQAIFWVSVDDSLDSDVTIYMYYGNAECSTTSNGGETFIFFDDFDDYTLDSAKWDAYGPWEESGGLAYITVLSGGNRALPTLRSDAGWDMRNKALAARWQFDRNNLVPHEKWGMSCTNQAGELSLFVGDWYDGPTEDIYFDLTDTGDYDFRADVVDSWPTDIFFRTEFASTPDGATKNQWWLDGESVATYNSGSFDNQSQKIFLGFYAYDTETILQTGSMKMDFDWVYLRKCAPTEPSHRTWGAEESPSSTTTSQTGQGGLDPMYVVVIATSAAVVALVIVLLRRGRKGG